MPPRTWASAEYLMWWITNGPNPVPLATAGNITIDGVNVGSLGASTTQVVLGRDQLEVRRVFWWPIDRWPLARMLTKAWA